MGARNDCRILISISLIVVFCAKSSNSARLKQETRDKFYGDLINTTATDKGDGSIAKMFDRVLEKEFSENDQPESQFITVLLLFIFNCFAFVVVIFWLKLLILQIRESTWVGT